MGDTFNMALKSPLTTEERHALERQVAEVSQKTFHLKEEKKLTMAPFTQKLKEAEVEEKKLLEQLSQNETEREVQCQRVADYFRGESWVVRLDTGEEVEDTRRALSDSDRQAMLPGMAVEVPVPSAAEAEELAKNVTPLFTQKKWSVTLASPLERWKLEETTENSSGDYNLVDSSTWQMWGPFRRGESGIEPGLDSDTFKGLADQFGAGVADAQALMAEVVSVINRRELELAATPEPTPSEGEGAPEGGLDLHEVPDIPGWTLYVHDGAAYLRPPNLDRFHPPASPQDKGPLRWDASGKRGRWDVAEGAAPELDAWVRENERIVECADALVHSGKVVSPTPRPTAPSEVVEVESSGAEVQDEESEAGAPGGKLSLQAKMLLKLMAVPGAPTDTPTLGSRARCRAGAVLNALTSKGLVDKATTTVTEPATGKQVETVAWTLTEHGRTVAASLTEK